MKNSSLNLLLLSLLVGLLLNLMGCSRTLECRVLDDNGIMTTIGEIELSGAGMAKIETPKGFKMEFDTRERNFWEKNGLPALTGMFNKTQAVVE